MKNFVKLIIIMVLTSVLKRITYEVGGLHFDEAPFFSLGTFYDFSIFVVYFVVIASIVEIIIKKNNKKQEQS